MIVINNLPVPSSTSKPHTIIHIKRHTYLNELSTAILHISPHILHPICHILSQSVYVYGKYPIRNFFLPISLCKKSYDKLSITVNHNNSYTTAHFFFYTNIRIYSVTFLSDQKKIIIKNIYTNTLYDQIDKNIAHTHIRNYTRISKIKFGKNKQKTWTKSCQTIRWEEENLKP